MEKLVFEMKEDERSLTRLEQALHFAVTEMTEGYSNSNIYDTEEGNILALKVVKDVLNMLDDVKRLKELALCNVED